MQKRRVGILGTSANPLHEGHTALALSVLDGVHLDEVRFMVNQNPFKSADGYASANHRMHLANLQVRASGRLGDGITVSEFEILLRHFDVKNTTAVMLEHFVETYPDLQPVWLMGTDNLAELHTWGRWTDIMDKYPVVVLGRDESREAAQNSVAAKQYGSARCTLTDFDCQPGTWCFMDGVAHGASSTEIRSALCKGETPAHISPEAIAYIRKYQLFGCTQ